MTAPLVRNCSDEVLLPDNHFVESRVTSRVNTPLPHSTPSVITCLETASEGYQATYSVKSVQFDCDDNVGSELTVARSTSRSMFKPRTEHSERFLNPYSGGKRPRATTSLATQWQVPKHNRSVQRLAYSAGQGLHSARSTDDLTAYRTNPYQEYFDCRQGRLQTPAHVASMHRSGRSRRATAMSTQDELVLANSLPLDERKMCLARVAYGSSTPAPMLLFQSRPRSKSGQTRGKHGALQQRSHCTADL